MIPGRLDYRPVWSGSHSGGHVSTVRDGHSALVRATSLRLCQGGRVRLQNVEPRSNPLFWALLKRLGERAPAPMLLNTSFDLFGEPLSDESARCVAQLLLLRRRCVNHGQFRVIEGYRT